jgi:hypothetical protein
MAIAANFPTVRPSLLLDFSNPTVLDPRVTFARTTTALYYDNKSAALAEQNLLTYSNTFTNAYWDQRNIGVPVLNATDPTGTASGAYTLTASATTSVHSIQLTSAITIASTTTYTFSAYLQAGAGVGSFIYAALSASTGSANYINANFTLSSTGTAGTPVVAGTFTSVGATIAQIGSTAWYRCSISFSTTSGASFNPVIQFSNSATPTVGASGFISWTAAGTETILAYGAQLEQRSAPTVYTATTATAVNTYTPTLQSAAINAPRFDYNPTTRESLGLLLEQASTNSFLYSSDYTNAAWTKTACTITAAADISPDGSQNAQLMALTATTATHGLYQGVTWTAASYTVSAYLKYYGQQYVQVYATVVTPIYCNFDLVNGTAGTASGVGSPVGNIQNVGNGWYRCSITFTGTANSGNAGVFASNSLTAAATPSFAGNGFNGYLVWGAQVELAPSATSYIATVASAQTRTVDAASMTGTNFTSWYNYSGGTLYLEASLGYTALATSMVGITDSASSSNYILMQTTASAVGFRTVVLSPSITANFTAVLPASATLVSGAFYKSAVSYSVTGTALVGGGGTVATSANNPLPSSVNQLLLTNPPLGPNASTTVLNGRIKKFAYYPLPLTNTQIQSLSAN